jgi:uncharacterized 2Fe-2S/4Fe-4S cluster protein (DUF4445 family)
MEIKMSVVDDPIAVDKAQVKKYKIPKEVELHPRQKLAYLEDQLQSIKTMHWRSRVDVIHAKRLQESPIEALATKGNNNLMQHVNEVEQTIGAIIMLNKLIQQLKDESPGLEATPADYPE